MILDNFGRRFFSMYDPEPKGLTEIVDQKELRIKNDSNHGIFWTVNEFENNKPRKKEFLKNIHALAFEIDNGTKEEQVAKIKTNITPSMVIETRRGFHNYFFVNDFEPDADAYRDFLLDRVIGFYDADKNAADATRILRVPTFNHWKDVKNPFMVKCVHLNQKQRYNKKQLENFFPKKEKKVTKEIDQFKKDLSFQKDTDLFFRIYNQNQGTLLKRLSGTQAVGMEKISFKQNKSGYQIIVDNKSTGSWIDKNGMIGSSSGGSPTVWQWINWYHKDHKKTYALLKEFLPELFDESK